MELDRARDALCTGQTLLLDQNELALAAPRIALGRGIAGLEAAQDHLTQFLRSAGCHKRILYRAEIVVKETVANIRQHGERADRPARAWLEAWIGDQRAVIAVEDDGPPFDPMRLMKAPPNGSADAGRGMRVIRRNTDDVRYIRTQTGRNRLELHIGLNG
jgi:anti-sigma regulatory factor (Ser/Thr protein kinase)